MEIRIFQSETDGKYYFDILASQDFSIIKSKAYPSSSARDNGLRDLIASCKWERNFRFHSNSDGSKGLSVIDDAGAILQESRIFESQSDVDVSVISLKKLSSEGNYLDYVKQGAPGGKSSLHSSVEKYLASGSLNQSNYKVWQSEKDSKFYFAFSSLAGKPLLSSSAYESLNACMKGVTQLVNRVKLGDAVKKKISGDGGYYFDVLSDAGSLIAKSPSFPSESKLSEALTFLRQGVSPLSDAEAGGLERESIANINALGGPRQGRGELQMSKSGSFGSFHWQISQQKDSGKHFFEFLDNKGKQLLQSQGYASEAACLGAVRTVQDSLSDLDSYQAKTNAEGLHYFDLTSSNGLIIASSRSFAAEATMKAMIARLKSAKAKKAGLASGDSGIVKVGGLTGAALINKLAEADQKTGGTSLDPKEHEKIKKEIEQSEKATSSLKTSDELKEVIKQQEEKSTSGAGQAAAGVVDADNRADSSSSSSSSASSSSSSSSRSSSSSTSIVQEQGIAGSTSSVHASSAGSASASSSSYAGSQVMGGSTAVSTSAATSTSGGAFSWLKWLIPLLLFFLLCGGIWAFIQSFNYNAEGPGHRSTYSQTRAAEAESAAIERKAAVPFSKKQNEAAIEGTPKIEKEGAAALAAAGAAATSVETDIEKAPSELKDKIAEKERKSKELDGSAKAKPEKPYKSPYRVNSFADKLSRFIHGPESGTPILHMDKVRWLHNSARLNTGAYKQVDNLAEILKNNKNVKIEIIGHRDVTEKQDYEGIYGENITLAIVRSRCLYKRLLKKGIPEEQMTFVGYDDKKPVQEGNSDEALLANRRIEVRVLRK